MLATIKSLFRDESGATAVEYGLIVAAVASAIVLAVYVVGDKVNNALNSVASAMP